MDNENGWPKEDYTDPFKWRLGVDGKYYRVWNTVKTEDEFIEQFICENFVFGFDRKVSSKDLMAAWRKFVIDHNINSRRSTRYMNEVWGTMGFQRIISSGQTHWRGLRLKTDEDRQLEKAWSFCNPKPAERR